MATKRAQMPAESGFGLSTIINMATGGPETELMRLRKEPYLDKKYRSMVGDWDVFGKESKQSLGDWAKAFMQGQPERERMAGEESGAVGKYFSGEMDEILRRLRQRRSQAMSDITGRSLDYATRERKLGALGGPTGESSWLNRLAMKQSGDIMTREALDAAEQERRDLGYLEQVRLASPGRRQAIQDAALAARMTPEEVSAQELRRRFGVLGELARLIQENTMYGTQVVESPWAGFARGLDTGITNAASVAASIYGMAGGMGGGADMGGGGAPSTASLAAQYPALSGSPYAGMSLNVPQGGGGSYGTFSSSPYAGLRY